ncbi:29455_t:CDS:2 [Gigaspora margarita]|uniref:29455_t:CDS:1 n=1 Tax=Gigaspora margarita TaxID=4874 RepID=A0ABN7VSK6_GIGMA|nr:29455_t:CDS:2 [Gigaspora margarita]
MLIKAESNGTLASYYRDHKDEYICSNCYNAIVVNGASAFKEHAIEWERGLKRHRKDDILSMLESISLLTNIIFEQEIIGNDPPIVLFSQLRSVAKSKNDQLSYFFNEIEAMVCLDKKSKAEQKELDRSLAFQCYLMCWNQSMAVPLWNLKDKVVENDNNITWVESVNILMKLLYDREKNNQEPVIYCFKQLRREMVAKNFRLSNFFDSIYNAALPENRSSKYLDKLDKKLAIECYIICSNQNSKLMAFKKDISFFIDLVEVSTEAIDITLYLESKKSSAFMLNVDDYHNIHTKRTPDTCFTSNAAHMTTLLLNNFHYMKRMAKTFNDQFHYEIPLEDKLENMTFHKYDNHIKEWQEERKMKDTILLDFFELSLKEMDSYIDALQQIISGFEDVFVVQKKSTYADEDHLALLMKKAEVFLLVTFSKIYQRLSQSSIVKGWNEKITCKLALLNITMDKRQMPLGFSSGHLPAYDKCNHCHMLLCDGTGKGSMVIACGHGYHESCFISLNRKCHYCVNILNLGIQANTTSLISRLSKLDKKKSNLKEFIDADEDSPQNQVISNEDDILEVLRKDKQALPRMEQAYSTALERFLNASVINI